MSSSVTIWQPPPPLKSAGVLYGWSLKHSNETLTGTTSGMWLLSIPSLIFFFKSKECLWLKGRIVCHLKDQIRAWNLETLCRRSLLPTTQQKLSLVATWRSKEKEYLMHADNCAAVRCIQQKFNKTKHLLGIFHYLFSIIRGDIFTLWIFWHVGTLQLTVLKSFWVKMSTFHYHWCSVPVQCQNVQYISVPKHFNGRIFLR